MVTNVSYILLNRRNTRQAVLCVVTQWLLPMEKRCVTPISLQATVMRIKKSLYFLTESLMRSIAGRFYHFREHLFQKETRVTFSIIFLSQYPKIQTAAKSLVSLAAVFGMSRNAPPRSVTSKKTAARERTKSPVRIKKKRDVWLKYIPAILDSCR